MRSRKPPTPAELERLGQLTFPDLFLPPDLRWPADWPRDRLESLDDPLREEAARVIAERLRSAAEEADVRDWRTWEALASARGFRTAHFCDIRGEEGRYSPPTPGGDTVGDDEDPDGDDGDVGDGGAGAACFAINYALASDAIVRAWVRAWAYHELYHWLPPRLRAGLHGAGAMAVLEQICRRVEELVLG